MNFFIVTILFLVVSSAFAQSQNEIEKNIQTINQEITKIDALVQKGESVEIYQDYLNQLKAEKEKYQKLLKKVTRIQEKSEKDQPVDQLNRKTIPTASLRESQRLANFKDEAVPLNERYTLILKALSNSQEVVSRLKDLPQDQMPQTTKNFIAEEEKKIAELEKLRVEYEVKVRELEDGEISSWKKSGLRVGAMIDLYYQWDTNKPDAGTSLPNRAYNNTHNDFTMNLIELNVFNSFKNIDFYADLDFGEFATQNGDADAGYNIGQAFLRYHFKEIENLTITAGKFYTHFGYEVAKAIENRNYSRSYAFTKGGPFWHEGIAINKSGVGNFGFGLYAYDKIDNRTEDNTGKTYGSQISFSKDKLTVIYNNIMGAQTANEGNMRTIHEMNATYNFSDTLAVVLDVLIGNEKNVAGTDEELKWSSVVGYVDLKTSNRNGLALRVENFKDDSDTENANNFFGLTEPANIMSYTLTNKYNLRNGAEVRLEYRLDQANVEMYPKEDGEFSKSQNTLTLAWLYSI